MPTFDELADEVADLRRQLASAVPFAGLPKRKILDWLENDADLDGGLLIGAGTVPDTSLASPSNATWKPYAQASAQFAGEAAATYFLSSHRAVAADLVPVGTNINTWQLDARYIDPAAHAVPGKTLQFRVSGVVLAAIAGGARTYNFALRELTAVTTGGAGDIGVTAAADYGTSATPTVNPAATSRNLLVTANPFQVTAASYFALVVTAVGAAPGFERTIVSAQLQYRHV